MPASSQRQQAFFRLVKAYQAGHTSVLKGLSKETAASIQEAAGSMSDQQVADFVRHPVTKKG